MRQRKFGIVWMLIAAFFMAVLFSACGSSSLVDQMFGTAEETAKPHPTHISSDDVIPEETPDQTEDPRAKPTVYSTFAQIGNAERPDGWTQIVQGNEFELGEMVYDPHLDFYQITYGTYPVIDGCALTSAMAREFAREHLSVNEDAVELMSGFLEKTGMYEDLITGNIDGTMQRITINEDPEVVLAGSQVQLVLGPAPSQEDYETAGLAGVKLVGEPVCRDALVLYTHPDSPIDDLDIQQLQRIYREGTATWNVETGGGVVISDIKIFPFQREEGASVQTSMQEEVMRGGSIAASPATEMVVGAEEMIRRVLTYGDSSATALGFTYKYYLDELYTGDKVKVLKVNGVEPTRENIENGTYPLVINYYGVIRSDEQNETPGQFLKWITSEEGQKCVEQAGYIPMG